MRQTFRFTNHTKRPFRSSADYVNVTVDLAAYRGRPASDAARDIVFSALAQIGSSDPRAIALLTREA
jgi:hypothetical protein